MNSNDKKSVVFIEVASRATNVFENFMRLPLTGTLYLGTILHNAGYRVRIYNETIMPQEVDPFNLHADVYCISSLTVAANRAKALAAQIRRIYPGAKIIIGGIHASLLPEDFTDVADHVVQGEAESIIVDLVEGRFSGKVIQGSACKDVESLPLVNYELIEAADKIEIIPIMTSRGCPFDCNFCTVTKIFGKRFRNQSPQRIMAEVKHALAFFKTRILFFYDDNFTANHARIDELCDLLIESDLNIYWTAQVRSDLARNPELIHKMVRAGCRWFYIGFESVNDATLKAMNKSQTRKDIEDAIRVIHHCGVNIHGMFIFGEDHDTLESIQETVRFAIEQHIDTVQFMLLTPFPGTRIYEDIASANRMLHKRWEYYNGMFTVFQPKNMSAARLQQQALEGYKKFYSLRRVSLDGLKLVFKVLIDALVWDFRHVFRYSFDSLVINAGAKLLLYRKEAVFDAYRNYLNDIESAADQSSSTDQTAQPQSEAIAVKEQPKSLDKVSKEWAAS